MLKVNEKIKKERKINCEVFFYSMGEELRFAIFFSILN